MNVPENGLSTDVSSKTTSSPSVFLQRTFWSLSLVVMGAVLAVHAALAYSPELAQFVPDSLITTSSLAPARPVPATGACHARTVVIGDFGGCSARGMPELPCLTDGLYEEDDGEDFTESPADAAECPSSDRSPSDDAVPQSTSGNASPSVVGTDN